MEGKGPASATPRAQRLATALRENLRRRKVSVWLRPERPCN